MKMILGDLIVVIGLGASGIAYVMLLALFIRGFLAAPVWERLQALAGVITGGVLGTILKGYLDRGNP